MARHNIVSGEYFEGLILGLDAYILDAGQKQTLEMIEQTSKSPQDILDESVDAVARKMKESLGLAMTISKDEWEMKFDQALEEHKAEVDDRYVASGALEDVKQGLMQHFDVIHMMQENGMPLQGAPSHGPNRPR